MIAFVGSNCLSLSVLHDFRQNPKLEGKCEGGARKQGAKKREKRKRRTMMRRRRKRREGKTEVSVVSDMHWEALSWGVCGSSVPYQ